jgi:hypothetical protein
VSGRYAFCRSCRAGSRYSSLDEPCETCGKTGMLAWEDPGQLILFAPPQSEREETRGKKERSRGKRGRK